jgi:hypothetical protein
MFGKKGYVERIVGGMICAEKGHDWRPTSQMYSDGWTRKCERCGKEESVTQ